jgi:ribosome modulation factor
MGGYRAAMHIDNAVMDDGSAMVVVNEARESEIAFGRRNGINGRLKESCYSSF